MTLKKIGMAAVLAASLLFPRYAPAEPAPVAKNYVFVGEKATSSTKTLDTLVDYRTGPLEVIHVNPFLPKVVLDHFVEAPIAFSTCLYGGDFRFSVSLASYRGPADVRYLRGLWYVEKQRTGPTFHEVMNCLHNDIAPSVLPVVEKRVHNLYQKIEAERIKNKYRED